jgi:hypothetical protein
MYSNPNDNYTDTLNKIKEISKLDKNCVLAFAHGSSIGPNTHEKSIYEIRIFKKNNFKGSVFGFKKMQSDIDCIWITKNSISSKNHINSHLHSYKNNIPVTINIVDFETFLCELKNPAPKALKHVFLVKKLYFLKNPLSGFFYRLKYRNNIKSKDLEFIKEFAYRKRVIRYLLEKDLNCEIFLDIVEQNKLFPSFTSFLKGELQHSFPRDRIKLVFPKPMGLKHHYDIETKELKELR